MNLAASIATIISPVLMVLDLIIKRSPEKAPALLATRSQPTRAEPNKRWKDMDQHERIEGVTTLGLILAAIYGVSSLLDR